MSTKNILFDNIHVIFRILLTNEPALITVNIKFNFVLKFIIVSSLFPLTVSTSFFNTNVRIIKKDSNFVNNCYFKYRDGTLGGKIE